jgi:RNA polymerase sigma factor (sigma-70 family)
MTGVDATLNELAERAVRGDRDAVEGLVRALQSRVYGLALRMLWCREDAEDATQEILVRVVTRLAQFDGRSALGTWVYRIATNYLLDVKKSAPERQRLTFAAFADDLADGQADDGPGEADRSVLVEEVKLGCTLAMLQCLDRPHRAAYILVEILDLSAPDAAAALDIDAAALRKRVQRAREAIEAFTRTRCGLVSDDAACRCNRRVGAAVRLGRADADRPRFATGESSFVELRAVVRRVEHAQQLLQIYRAATPRDSEVDFAHRLVTALDLEPRDS